ncbi:MAG: ATP-binding protein [Dehalococcoidales bacterium]|nr:ATP-binding protein [Dehalococcoidales bacterium]
MIVSIASGKGGTGKTLVATSLARSLGDKQSLQFADCDVEEPNAHLLLQPTFSQRKVVFILIPRVDEAKCTGCGKCAEVCAYKAIAVVRGKVLVFPELCHGCGACSYFCPEQAISEVGKEIGVVESGNSGKIGFIQGKLNVGELAAPRVIVEVKKHLNQGGLVIIDAPPGTSCPVVEAVKDADFCLLVTEPTSFGLNDLALAVEMTRKLDVPTGVVINRNGIGDHRVEEYCLKEGIPILLRIPLDIEIARLYSRGVTLVDGMPQWKEAFRGLFSKIERIVN